MSFCEIWDIIIEEIWKREVSMNSKYYNKY